MKTGKYIKLYEKREETRQMIKILIPMIEAGSGHKTPSMAVKDALDELYPGKCDVKIIDFAHECGAKKDDKTIKKVWDYLVFHDSLAKTMNAINKIGNDINFSADINILTRIFYAEFTNKGALYLKKYTPDLVFATHFMCAAVAVYARKKYNLNYKIISYMTDPFIGHTFWMNSKVDHLLVASEEAKQYLLSCGQDPSIVSIMPFPIHKKFFQPISSSDKSSLLKYYGLDQSKRTLLAIAGGQGIGRTFQFIYELVQADYPLNIIAVCGKNPDIQRDLQSLKIDSNIRNFMVLGYANNINELLDISDICLTKAGANSTLETLVKGVPPIFLQYLGMHEKGNIDYCVRNKFGWHVNNSSEMYRLLDQMLNSEMIEEYKENIKKDTSLIRLRDASSMLAEYLYTQVIDTKSHVSNSIASA